MFSMKYFELKCSGNGGVVFVMQFSTTVELQWLEHLWNHEDMFETGVVRANGFLS